LLDRDAEHELIPVCRHEGAGVIAWSPLAGGWLSGKYKRDLGGPPAGSRGSAADWQSRGTDRTWRVVDALGAVADETGRTPAQVALRWVMQRPGLTAPIIGVRTPAQLADNLGATGWALDDDQMRRLTEAGDSPLPYPHDLLAATPVRPSAGLTDGLRGHPYPAGHGRGSWVLSQGRGRAAVRAEELHRRWPAKPS
jgi:aryl-alcohol dehydrogenase-like predicted oxidoreductase